MNWRFTDKNRKTMKIIYLKYVITLILFAGFTAGCEKLEDTYSEYTGDGPEQYLSKIYDLQGSPQWLSVLLTWNLKLDPGRTAILVKWTDDEKTDSVILDKDSESYLVQGLKNYEYKFSVNAIEQKDGETIKYSIDDPVYVRPYSYESDELALFTRVVNKSFNVVNKQLFVTFDTWADNLISFKIGYYEKNNEEEQFWEATPEDNVDNYPHGKPYALIGENIDFSRPINVYRTGKVAEIGDVVLDLNPIAMYFDVPSFESDFAAEVRNKFDLTGEIKWSDIENVESLEIDYDQVSLTDILHFSRLKELHLGKNRYLASGTENQIKSTIKEQELSLVALEIAAKLGVKIYHYGKHYFDIVPDFFTTSNVKTEIPVFTYLDPSVWTIEVSPEDALGYNSGLGNLLRDDNTQWLPQPDTRLREHIIEIDMQENKNIAGFKIVQAAPSDSQLKLPATLRVEVQNATGQWLPATYQEDVTIGNGKGETTIVYLDKIRSSKITQKIRVKISDSYYKKQWNSSAGASLDYYNVALSSFIVIQGD